MRICRYLHDKAISYGVFEDDHIRKISGDLFGDHEISDEKIHINDIRLLAPVDPPNIIAIGANYLDHIKESGSDIPDHPLVFIKLTTSLNDPGNPIILPGSAPDEVDYEAELAVIIAEKARFIEPQDALKYILGYTCANDISARDCQLKKDKQWARGKSFDTFCPLGPVIQTSLDADNADIKTRLNGTILQHSNTSEMIFKVPELISYLSKNFTLLPGTVILTGTPKGVGMSRQPQKFLRKGDSIEVEIEGIGILKNHVISDKDI